MKKIALLLSALIMIAATASAQLPSGQFLGPDQTVCPGGAGLGFNGSEPGFNPAWAYQWSTTETTAQIFYPYPSAGNYTVWCKVSLNGNSVTDTVHYTVYPPVAVPSLVSTAAGACVDQATVSTPFTSGYTYQWSKADPANPGNYITLTGQTGNAITVTQSGTYRIKVTNQGGCFEYNELAVSTLGKPKKYLHDTAFCQTSGMPNFSIGDNINVNCTYLWNQGNTGDDWVINPNAYQPTPVTYWVTITNANGCTEKDTITWVAHPAPTPQLNSGLYTCGDTVTLRDQRTEYDHIWKYNGNILSTSDSLMVNYAGSFQVTTTSANGCSVVNTVTVFNSPGVNVAGFNHVPQLPSNPRKFNFSAITPQNVNTYDWDFGDGTTSNLPNPIHDYTTNTDSVLVTLTVSNTNFNGQCRYKTISLKISTNLDVDTAGPTSIKEIANEASLNVYPNPTQNIVNIKVAQGSIETVIVTDMVGRNITTNSVKSKETVINLSSTTPGMYLVKVEVKTSKGTAVITKKINKL